MKRLLGLLLVSMLAFALLAGCGGNGNDTTFETVGEGAAEGQPVFYEFFSQG